MKQEKAETGQMVRRKNELKRTVLQRIGDWLFGYDFFISYCWKDGRKYAVELAKQLTKNGYACFLDSTDYAMGDDWKLVGERALRHSSQCVLVATQGARKSKPVQREITIFRKLGRKIVPIQFDHSLVDDGEFCELRQMLPDEILRISERVEQLESGPNTDTLQSIVAGFRKQTQEQKRTKFFAAASVVFAALTVIAGTFWVQAVRAKNEAVNLNVNSIYDLGQFTCSASRERLGLLQLAKGFDICSESQLAMTQTYGQSLSLWTNGLAIPAGYIPSGTAMTNAIDPIAFDLEHAVVATERMLRKDGGIAFNFYDLPNLTPSLRYPPVILSEIDANFKPIAELNFGADGVLKVAWLDQASLNTDEKLSGSLRTISFDPRSGKREEFKLEEVEIDGIIQSPNSDFLATIDSAGFIQFWRRDDNSLIAFAQLESNGRLGNLAGITNSPIEPLENWVLSHDGKLIAIEHDDRVVRVWNTSDATLQLAVEPPRSPMAPVSAGVATRELGTSILFSDDDMRIWTCSDGHIRCWSSDDGTLLGGADGTGIEKMKSISTDGKWIVGEYQHAFKVSRNSYHNKPAAKLFEVLGSENFASNVRLRQIVFGFYDTDINLIPAEVGSPFEDFQYQPFDQPTPVVEPTEVNGEPPMPISDEVPPAPDEEEPPPAPEDYDTASTIHRLGEQMSPGAIERNVVFTSIPQEATAFFPLEYPRLFMGNSPVPVVRDIVFHASKPLASVQFESGSQVWDLTVGRQTLARALPYGNDTALVQFGTIGKNVDDDTMISTDMTGTRSFVLDKNSLMVNSLLAYQYFQSEEASGNVYTCQNPFRVSPDGRVLAEFNDETLKLWDLQAFRERGRWNQIGQTLELTGWDTHSVNFSPDSSSFVLIAFKDKVVSPLFESKDAKIIRVSATDCKVMNEHSPIYASRLSMSDDTRFVVGNVSLRLSDSLMTEQTEVKIVDLLASKSSPKTFGQQGIIEFAELSPGADLLFTAADNRVIFWNVNNEEKLFEFAHASDVTELACFDDGKKLFVATEAGLMRVWNVAEKIPQFAEIAHMHQLDSSDPLQFAASQDDSCFATGGDEWVRIWNTDTGKQMGPDIATSGSVVSIEFIQNDHFLAIRTDDLRTTFFQLQTTTKGPPMQPAWIERLTAASLNSSGSLVSRLDLASKADGEAEVRSPAMGTPVTINIVPLDSNAIEEQTGPGRLRIKNWSTPDLDIAPSDSDATPMIPIPVVDHSA